MRRVISYPFQSQSTHNPPIRQAPRLRYTPHMKTRRLLLYAGLLLATLCAGVYLWLFWDLPAPDDLSAYAAAPSSKILDRHGRLLFEMPPPYTGSHTPVALEAIPDALIWATIATEDASFYENPGMDAI